MFQLGFMRLEMQERSLADEARQCREWAKEFTGRPEGPILLKIAHEFEQIAAVPRRERNRPRP